MTKLLLLWGVWRLARVAAAIMLITALATLVLTGGGRTSAKPNRHSLTKIERALQPVVRQLQLTLEKGLKP
jgi:hypothetical protein